MQPNIPRQETPRDRYRAIKDQIAKHRILVDGPDFQSALHFGMLQYQEQLSAQVKDGNTAMAVGFKLQGALEVLAVIKNLGEQEPRLSRVANDNLNHQA